MRTVRTKVYQFNELNEGAKQIAIENYRNNDLQHDFIYQDAECTVMAFNSLFGIQSGNHSWLDFSTSHIEDSILNLSGLRLHKYILNNYFTSLFKNKYLKHSELTEDFKPYHKMRKQKTINSGPNKGKISSSYYSNWKVDNCCVLTGMCYDNDMLDPIYDFLNYPDSVTTFENLISECFNAIKKTIQNEIEYRDSDESIIEEIESGDYEFTEKGNKF